MASMKKNTFLAFVLNLVLPGLGYLYVGQKRQFLSVGLTISSVVGYLSSAVLEEFDAALVISALLFAVVLAVDAYQDAKETIP